MKPGKKNPQPAYSDGIQFLRTPYALLRLHKLPPTTKLVLQILMTLSDDRVGYTRASREYIALQVGISRKHLLPHLTILTELGYLTALSGSRRVLYRYRLEWGKLLEPCQKPCPKCQELDALREEWIVDTDMGLDLDDPNESKGPISETQESLGSTVITDERTLDNGRKDPSNESKGPIIRDERSQYLDQGTQIEKPRSRNSYKASAPASQSRPLNVFDSSNLEDQSRIVGIEPTLERDIDLADRKKISGSKEVKTDLVVEIDPIDAIAGKGSELDASQQKRETCAKEKDRPPASGPLRAWAPLALQGYRLDQRDLEALDRADTLSWQGKTPARLGWQKIMLLYYRAEWIKSFSWATKSPKPETFQIPYVIGMISKDSVQSSDYPKALKYCNDQCSRHSQSLSAVLAKGEQYPPEHEICLRQTQRTYFNPDDPNKPACAVCLKYSDEINKKASEESQGLFGPNAKKKRFVL